MKEIDLFKLYDKFDNRDISQEANALSNLSDKEIIDTLNNNWASIVDRRTLKKYKTNVEAIYHKVVIYSSKEKRKPASYEGFYSLKWGNSKKYFTSFKKLSTLLMNEKLVPAFKVWNYGGSEE